MTNREALDSVVADWTRSRAMRDIARDLDAAEVPCSPINSIADIFSDSQYIARETLLKVDHPVLGELQIPAIVPRLSRSPGVVSWLGPGLGEDTDSVLEQVLGYTQDRVARLHSQGVV